MYNKNSHDHYNILTACHTSGEFDCVPGCGLSDGGAEDNAESLSDPDKS